MSIKLVSDNGPIRRKPSKEWEASFIKGGLYALPEKPLDFVNPTPGNQSLSASFGASAFSGDKVSFDTLPKLPPLSETPAWLNLEFAMAEAEFYSDSAAGLIAETRTLFGSSDFLFE